MDPYIIDLIEDHVDGLSNPEKDEELRNVLAEHQDARAYLDFLQELAGNFKKYKGDLVAIDVSNSVMRRIQTSSPDIPQIQWQPTAVSIDPSKPSPNSKTMAIRLTPLHFILAASILMAVAFGSYYAGSQSSQDTTEEAYGTMADGVKRAKRYRQSPIQNKDVILENQQFQKVFQSDQFMKLVKSGQLTQLAALPEFQAVIFNSSIVNLFSTPGLAELAMQPDFASLASQLNFQTMYTNEFQQLTQDLNFVAAFNNPELMAFLNSPEFQGLQSLAELQALQFNNPSFQELSKNFQALLMNPEYNATIFNNSNFSDMLQSLASIQNLNFNCCLQRGNEIPYLTPQALELMANPELQAMLKNPDFVQLFSSAEFSQLMNNADFQTLMSSPGFIELLANPELLGYEIIPF